MLFFFAVIIFKILHATVLQPNLSGTVLSSVKRRNCSFLGNCECQKVWHCLTDVWSQQHYRFIVWKGFSVIPSISKTFCQAPRPHCVQLHRRQERQSASCDRMFCLMCVNCWHFLSKTIAGSSVENSPTHTYSKTTHHRIPPDTEMRSALCSL